MRKLLITISVFTVLNASAQSKHENDIRFFPDTTVNKKLKLLNSESIQLNLGDQNRKLIEDESASQIHLRNTGGDQYLTLYHLPGSNANAFNQFEIGLLKGKSKLYRAIQVELFQTESGIRTGIPLEKLHRIKGRNYTKSIKNGFVVIEYRIEQPNAIFLKRYNMPLYNAQYYFKENKLQKFIFGFPNP